ncbi:MAG: hypothetical protein WD851_18645 [Pirellulales bacterium]
MNHSIETPAEFEHELRRLELEALRVRQAYERKFPKHIGDVAAESLQRAADKFEKAQNPFERKRVLAQQIKILVGCPHFGQVSANRAAEYVVFKGLPPEVMDALLEQLDLADKRGQVRPYVAGKGGGRGGWFNGVLKLRLLEYGIKELKKRGTDQ